MSSSYIAAGIQAEIAELNTDCQGDQSDEQRKRPEFS
jgi:hypothetical protein